jgi:2-polyprenyl-3-methyl-5-hydroxy-6-metoxy-1,4-benzoquinol methylase
MTSPTDDPGVLKRRTHWERFWSRNKPDEMGWFQASPEVSLGLIDATGIDRSSRIIDVGGGTSTLVDSLLDRGFENIGVLDISESAIDLANARLGERSTHITWIAADVTVYRADQPIDLWHDRAVLHFLTERDDRERYARSLIESLAPRGHVIIAAFALDGPKKCAGLEVIGYGPREIMALLGDGFELQEIVRETHITPGRTKQRFAYFRLQRQH